VLEAGGGGGGVGEEEEEEEEDDDDVRSCETSGTAGATTRHSVPKDLNLQQHCCEDVRSRSGRCIVRRARQK